MKEVTGEDTPVPRCQGLSVILPLPFLFLVCIEQQHSFYVLGNLTKLWGQSQPGTAISMFAPCKKGPAVAFELILLPHLSHLNSTVDIVKINGLRLFIAVALNIIITWVRLVELPRASTFERSINKVAEMFISYSVAIMKHLHQHLLQLNNINGQLHYTVFNFGRWFYCVNRVKRSPWQSTMVGDFFLEWTELYISDTQITRKEILWLLL